MAGIDHQDEAMTSWNDVCAAAPDLADRVRTRIEAHGLALLATVRADGYPRVSGIEPLFALGELWLGMMPDSRKGVDLRRHDRLCLHSATVDKEVKDGDAKITGRGVEILDAETRDAVAAAFEAANGYFPPGPFDLFRVEICELALVHPGLETDTADPAPVLVIESWRTGEAPKRVERR